MRMEPGATALRDLLSLPGPQAAPHLLGWRLTASSAQGAVSVALTEVEAYDGGDDPASHAFRGQTPRNAVMFGEAGRLYVYFTYGMHWCANVVCGPPGTASAVLLRAGRVVEGEALARVRRGPRVPSARLARGPATLTQALGVTGVDNGADLLTASRLRLSPPPEGDLRPDVSSGPRVGVRGAPDVAWRFWVTGDATVSAYRRSPRA
jgi:DNA-3-methyladenine glycosylase